MLCRVPHTLGKGTHALGKSFAKCNTRQRGSVEPFHGKACFAECQISGTRQRLCRVSSWHSAKDWRPLAEGSRRLNFFFNFFAECNTRQRIFFFFQNSLPSAIAPRHSAKPVFIFLKFSLPSATAKALGKAFFIFFNFLCRVQWPLHSANLGNCCCYFPSFAECNGHCTRQSHSKIFVFVFCFSM